MEREFEKDPALRSRLGKFVLSRLWTYGRPGSERWAKYLETRFGTSGVPYYAILTPDDRVLATLTFPGGSLDPFKRRLVEELDAAVESVK